MSTDTMPTIYLGHGAPPLVDNALWTSQLANWAERLPRPKAILVVSAHWESAPLTIGATQTGVPLTYDFYGFPQRYYETRYRSPGAPELARRVKALITNSGAGRVAGAGSVAERPDYGLDHGAYVPLSVMYPDADIPVLQISMPSLDPSRLLELGRQLAPLRDEGVLIVGSGFFTHNLLALRLAPETDSAPPSWSVEFDEWGRRALGAQDLDALIDFEYKAPAVRLAHPRTEHFAPLFVVLGAGEENLGAQQTVIEGYWHGLAKRSLQFG
jgi:4,5-DOPA dioxygenase extradiol